MTGSSQVATAHNTHTIYTVCPTHLPVVCYVRRVGQHRIDNLQPQGTATAATAAAAAHKHPWQQGYTVNSRSRHSNWTHPRSWGRRLDRHSPCSEHCTSLCPPSPVTPTPLRPLGPSWPPRCGRTSCEPQHTPTGPRRLPLHFPSLSLAVQPHKPIQTQSQRPSQPTSRPLRLAVRPAGPLRTSPPQPLATRPVWPCAPCHPCGPLPLPLDLAVWHVAAHPVRLLHPRRDQHQPFVRRCRGQPWVGAQRVEAGRDGGSQHDAGGRQALLPGWDRGRLEGVGPPCKCEQAREGNGTGRGGRWADVT